MIFRKNYTPPPTPRVQQLPLSRPRSVAEETSSFAPSSTGGINTLNTQTDDDIDDLVVDKARILAAYGGITEPTGIEISDEDMLANNPTLAYVHLKLKVDEISSKPRSQLGQEQLKQLRQKLNDISQDYLFDEKDAFVRYKEERKKLDQQLLHERLRRPGPDLPGPSKSLGEKKPAANPTGKSRHVLAGSDDSDDSSVGMLGILEDPNANEITVKGVTFSLRDMAVPKHWSGPMPKTMLRDFVAKADRYAAISYTTLSDRSRARRAGVSISWQNKQRDEWTMDDVACSEDSQAEQYVAAIALHSLTYPLTEGFVASVPANTSGSTSFRLLPAVYRDLWDELEISRKARDDSINRQIWARLQSIFKDKAQRSLKVCD